MQVAGILKKDTEPEESACNIIYRKAVFGLCNLSSDGDHSTPLRRNFPMLIRLCFPVQ